MKAASSPRESQGGFSGIAGKVAPGEEVLWGREIKQAPTTYFRGILQGGEGSREGHLACVSLSAGQLLTLASAVHSFCICSQAICDYGDVPF